MRKLVGFGIVVVAAILTWHLFIWSKLPSNAIIDVNPLTDVVHIKIASASQMGFTDSSSISAFNGVRDLVGGTIAERQMSNYAREYFDTRSIRPSLDRCNWWLAVGLSFWINSRRWFR
jgi:hypothetical protein